MVEYSGYRCWYWQYGKKTFSALVVGQFCTYKCKLGARLAEHAEVLVLFIVCQQTSYETLTVLFILCA